MRSFTSEFVGFHKQVTGGRFGDHRMRIDTHKSLASQSNSNAWIQNISKIFRWIPKIKIQMLEWHKLLKSKYFRAKVWSIKGPTVNNRLHLHNKPLAVTQGDVCLELTESKHCNTSFYSWHTRTNTTDNIRGPTSPWYWPKKSRTAQLLNIRFSEA